MAKFGFWLIYGSSGGVSIVPARLKWLKKGGDTPMIVISIRALQRHYTGTPTEEVAI